MLLAIILIAHFVTEKYDVIEYCYDPATGQQKTIRRKSRRWADKVAIENVLGVMQDNVLFSCQFERYSVFYDFPSLDENNREKITEIPVGLPGSLYQLL